YAIDNAQLVPGPGDGFIYRIRFFGETDGVGAVHFDNMLLTELGTGRQSFRDFAATSPLFAAGVCIDRSSPSKAANIAVSWNDGQSLLRFAGVDVWYNNGGGSMTQSSAVLASNTNSATPAVLLEDLNADGISDLVYQLARVGSSSGSNQYAVGAADYPGGPTRFEGASGIPTATGATRFRSGRLAGASSRGIIFDDPWRVQALGMQGNAFSARLNPLLTIGSSRRFCAFDAEGDESDGVVTVAGSADGRMQYFRALVDDGSAPRFAPAATVGTADIASAVHNADVDSDGVPDLVVLEKDRVVADRWFAGAYINLRDPAIICIGDFNHDGGVDGTDAFEFMTAWEQGAATADLNSDGGIDGQDVNTFFEAWESGC
ncbi:MAG: hypothetical protein NTV94_04550, partial [Planctomycetota bacterium]|nr:hypothetical protein [Planctomycetota bacterium]